MKEVLISFGLLVIGIVLLVMIHIFIVRRLFGGEQGRSHVGLLRRRGTSTRKISIEDLNSLPCFDHVGEEGFGSISAVECTICLENFKSGEKCRSLPNCGHYFHVHCVDSWLLNTPICPICRNCIAFDDSRTGTIPEKEEQGDARV